MQNDDASGTRTHALSEQRTQCVKHLKLPP